jgi:hypothetical protein
LQFLTFLFPFFIRVGIFIKNLLKSYHFKLNINTKIKVFY